ncbi:MAG: MFS transporter [Candidatus Thorarchaeota archaeon]
MEKINESNLINAELTKQQYLRYFIFGIIYLHQGFIEVFMYTYMALYLLSFGLSIFLIGLTIGLGTSPWLFKIFYGMASDRKGSKRWGRRIPYMLVGSFFAAILFFTLIPVNPLAAWVLFTSIIFAANFFNALCDTATDGLVIDTTSPEKRGSIQSLCWGSKFVGYITAALLVGFMVEIFSWTIYFVFMGIFLLLPIPFLFITKEPPYKIPEKFPLQDFKDTFKKRLVWLVLIFFIISELGLWIVLSMLPLFLSIELNLSLSLVGIVMAVAYGSFLIGCIISGPILDRLSRRISVSISIVFLSVIFFLASLVLDILMVLVIIVFAGISWGIFQIVKMTLSMDLCKKSISATLYSIYMSILNIGGTLGTIIGAFLVEMLGFRITFIIASFIVLSTLILVVFIKGTEKLFAGDSEISN